MSKQKTYFTSELRITFTGKTPIDANGNKEVVDMVSKSAVAFISAFKNTYPDVQITTDQVTDFSDEPIEVQVTKKKIK